MSGGVRQYEGNNIRVTYDFGRCIHARECVHGLPEVFDPDQKPWISADSASADRVAEVVRRCPTGALQYERKDGGAGEPVPTENVVDVAVDGPLYVRGKLKIVDGDGTLKLEDTRVAFCRCGASENKPFCDGRHEEAGFDDEAALREPKPAPDGFAPGGAIAVTPRPNGPLFFQGSVVIRSADGTQSSFHEKVSLCRCGASSKKPFCDGSHKQIGFVAET